jgi:hypothetical protein
MELFDFTTWSGLVRLLLVLVVPLLVAVVTKRLTAVWLKVLVLAVLSAASTVLTALSISLNDPSVPFVWPNEIGNALVGIILSQAAYWLGWKPWGVTDKIAAVTENNPISIPASPARTRRERGYSTGHGVFE